MKKLMTLMLGMALLSGGVAVTLRMRRQHRREPMSNRTPGQPGGIPPEMAATLAGPIPAVDPEDMRRIWPIFEQVWQEQQHAGQGAGATGIDSRLLAQHCSPGADVNAISFRVAVVKTLLHQGLLDAWKDGDTLRPVVFEVIAKCRLEPAGGRLGFDTEAILAAIESGG